MMPEDEVIVRVTDLARGCLAALLAESEASGYRFLRRLVDEWQRGVNRFSCPGEALFAAESGGEIVGVCGLNVDPYLDDPRVGRVRNVYVLAACRGRGIGRRLVERAVVEARDQTETARPAADRRNGWIAAPKRPSLASATPDCPLPKCRTFRNLNSRDGVPVLPTSLPGA